MTKSTPTSSAITMAEEQIIAITSALKTIQRNMPFLHRLSADERSKLQPINIGNRIFTENAIHVLVNNSDLQPEGFNGVEKQKAMALYYQLEDLRMAINLLAKRISDTQLLVGNETYLSAIKDYRHIENLEKAGHSEVGAVYNLLHASYRCQDMFALESEQAFDAYLGTW